MLKISMLKISIAVAVVLSTTTYVVRASADILPNPNLRNGDIHSNQVDWNSLSEATATGCLQIGRNSVLTCLQWAGDAGSVCLQWGVATAVMTCVQWGESGSSSSGGNDGNEIPPLGNSYEGSRFSINESGVPPTGYPHESSVP